MSQQSGQNGLGSALRQMRKAGGYTQETFATTADLARTTIVRLESGQGSLCSLDQALTTLALEVAGRNLPPGETLGKRLATLRKRRGLNQRALAMMVGATPNTITTLERTGCGRVETLDRVLTVLGAGLYLAPTGNRQAFYSHAGNSSVHHGWETPPELLTQLYAVFGRFDLDPCSPTKSARRAPVKARVHFTAEDDGLALPWHGRVFVNPPYGRELRQWVRKARTEVAALRASLVAMLLPARTDTAWWHDDIAGAADIYLLRGRLAFGDGTQSAPFPSALVVWDHVRQGGVNLVVV